MGKGLLVWVGGLALLAGCGTLSVEVNAVTPTQEQSRWLALDSEVPVTATESLTASIAEAYSAEEAQIKQLVEDFGEKLQLVSIQSPDAAHQIQEQYAELVSPTVLETWVKDASTAPGRIVSSPWPDRIEVTGMTQEAPDRYVVTGSLVEVTSVELLNGGAAAMRPVRVTVQWEQGRWYITEYKE